MKFDITLSQENLLTVMRRCGYAPETPGDRGEFRFSKSIIGRPYPRFHVYAVLSPEKNAATLNLHLDQKQPSYQGSSAHSGEYDGPLLAQEKERIQRANA